MKKGTRAAVLALLAAVAGLPTGAQQTSNVDALRQYEGTYEWSANEYVYIQRWTEFSGTDHLVAFDESGEVRTRYPMRRDRFFTGPSIADSTRIAATVSFQRDSSGNITELNWADSGGTRVARPVSIERRESVQFTSGNIRLGGVWIAPRTPGRHPVLILVHGSGAEDRNYIVPLAHFLVRHGMALFSYDKRGVGESTGDWRLASYDDLADDGAAALEYLKMRADVDSEDIGLFGWSQAGWVMPLIAARARDVAFLISISGAAVPPSETAVDEVRNEMTANGMKSETVQRITHLMELQYRFAGTREGWDDYFAARAALAARLGTPPASFPQTQDDATWAAIRRMYSYDPEPVLRRLRVPVLAIFGELDDNILAQKNRAHWENYLRSAGNPDYALVVLSKGNHLMLESRMGTNAEMAHLQRFVPEYFTTIRAWLESRVPGFGGRE